MLAPARDEDAQPAAPRTPTPAPAPAGTSPEQQIQQLQQVPRQHSPAQQQTPAVGDTAAAPPPHAQPLSRAPRPPAKSVPHSRRNSAEPDISAIWTAPGLQGAPAGASATAATGSLLSSAPFDSIKTRTLSFE